MSRRAKALGIATVGALLAIMGFFVFFSSPEGPSAPASNNPASPTATPQPDPISAENVRYLEQALNSDIQTEQAKVLPSMLRDDFLRQNQPALPPGTTVQLKTDTFVAGGDTGQIEAAASSGELYILHLIRENGMWLILYTEAK